MTRDRGSATVAMAAVMALLAAVVIATTSLGIAYGARAQAHSAADAAALAAAVATYPPARPPTGWGSVAEVAAANGAEVVDCTCEVDVRPRARIAVVTVGIPIEVPFFGRILVRATSRAEFDPRAWLGA